MILEKKKDFYFCYHRVKDENGNETFKIGAGLTAKEAVKHCAYVADLPKEFESIRRQK
jgi:hypothetical protein